MKDNYHKEYYLRNREKIKLSANLYYHQGKGKEVWSRFIEINREHYNKYHRLYEKKIKKDRTMTKKKQDIVLFFD